jgi:hypothetical protein
MLMRGALLLAATAAVYWAMCSAQATAQTAKDFDLACAVVTAAEVATTAKASRERDAAFLLNAFFWAG